MITRLAAWLEAASLVVLKEIYKLRNYCFFNTKALKTRMSRIHSTKPW